MLKDKDYRRKLIIFFSVFVGMYALFVVFHLIKVKIMGLAYPIGDFRFDPGDRFKDFFTINFAVKDRNPYISDLSNYPPLILSFAYLFSKLMDEDYLGYNPMNLQTAIQNKEIKTSLYTFLTLYVILTLVICVIFAVRKFKGERITAGIIAFCIGCMLIMSAPSVFMMDRGNYLAVTVVLFLAWAVVEQEHPDGMSAPVLLALCVATKIYPVYVLLIYVFKKEWKKTFTALFTVAFTSLWAMLMWRGSLTDNIDHFVKGVLGFGGSGFYASYFTVGITGLCQFFFRALGIFPITRITKAVWLLSGVVLTPLGFWFTRKEETLWKRIMVITALMVFLSPNSYLYNSSYMFAPIFLMLMDREKLSKKDIPYLIICALLLVPKAYKYIPDIPGDSPTYYRMTNIAVALDALLYMALFGYYFYQKISEYRSIRKISVKA